jgi:prepilin peptidase CpaA
MNPIVQWSTIILVLIAAASDLRSRRIPNRLVVPFLLAGIIVSCLTRGLHGLTLSVAGIAVAVAGPGVFVWLGGLGMGDLKLCAAVGAWIGPSQLVFALVITGLAGGVMALTWAARRRLTGDVLASAGDLITGMLSRRKPGQPPAPTLRQAGARSLPYAPAIAFGTIFSFFAS